MHDSPAGTVRGHTMRRRGHAIHSRAWYALSGPEQTLQRGDRIWDSDQAGEGRKELGQCRIVEGQEAHGSRELAHLLPPRGKGVRLRGVALGLALDKALTLHICLETGAGFRGRESLCSEHLLPPWEKGHSSGGQSRHRDDPKLSTLKGARARGASTSMPSGATGPPSAIRGKGEPWRAVSTGPPSTPFPYSVLPL
jgi:hypothetical protein